MMPDRLQHIAGHRDIAVVFIRAFDHMPGRIGQIGSQQQITMTRHQLIIVFQKPFIVFVDFPRGTLVRAEFFQPFF